MWIISYLCCLFPFTGEVAHSIIFLFLLVSFSILPREVPFAFVVKIIWCYWIILILFFHKVFYLSVKYEEEHAGKSILVYRFFPFTTSNISCHSLLYLSFCWKNQLITLWGFLCNLVAAFLCCFYYFLSILIFCQFDYCVSWCVPPWLICMGLCISWTWVSVFFLMLGRFRLSTLHILPQALYLSLILLGLL